jgi:hypothetical protein
MEVVQQDIKADTNVATAVTRNLANFTKRNQEKFKMLEQGVTIKGSYVKKLGQTSRNTLGESVHILNTDS